nr:hypothetical protein FVER53263_08799 [Fusarium verticillioides]
MNAFSFSILLGALLSQADAAEQKHIDEACNDVSGIVGCSSTFTYPDYPKAIYNGNGVQTDTTIVPKEVNICTAVEEALGSPDFVNNAETYCSCLSNAKPSYDGQINAHLTQGYLDVISREEACLSDSGYRVVTDRASVVRSQLAATNGWTILRAPEPLTGFQIDVAAYKKLAKAVMSCYTGTSGGPKVRAFFASYVQNSYSITESDFVGMLNKWVSLFDALREKTTDVQTYSKQVQARLKSVSAKVNSVKANMQARSQVKSLQGVPSAAGKSLANIPKMKQVTQNAIKYTTTPADEAYYLMLMNEYHINSLRDVIKAFRLTGTFNLISNHAGAAKTAATSINQILSVNWAKNSELSKPESGRKVRDGLISIQKSFRNDLKGPLENLIKANKAVEDILVQLPLRKKRLGILSGGVSYSHWIEAKMPVPCKKEETYCKAIGGIEGKMTYQEVQACEFGPQKVPFIKTVIPYMKYRFV